MSDPSKRGDPTDPDAGAKDLVAFFGALSEAARREYAALAALDREFGEDVARERRAAGGMVGGA